MICLPMSVYFTQIPGARILVLINSTFVFAFQHFKEPDLGVNCLPRPIGLKIRKFMVYLLESEIMKIFQ